MKPIELDFEPDMIFLMVKHMIAREILARYPNAISIIDAGRPTPEIIGVSKMVKYVVCSKNLLKQ